MEKPQALVNIFNNYLNEPQRKKILEEADISDDRPTYLIGPGGLYEEACDWMDQHRRRLAPLILRYVDPPDRFIYALVKEGDMNIPSDDSMTRSITLAGMLEFERQRDSLASTIPVLDLAVAAAFVSELFIDLAAANSVCGVWIEPPEVEIRKGSVEFILGEGGLFASGIGLLVACGTGLIGAPVLGVLAGATLATAGLYDLALGWRKQIAEIRKVEVCVEKTEMENHLAELEVKLKELELERARILSHIEPEYDQYREVNHLRARRPRDETYNFPPESLEVPRKLVQKNAESMNMTETYANHLLNRCLGKYRLLKQKLTGLHISLKSK